MDRDHPRLGLLLLLVAILSGYVLESPRAQVASAVPSPSLPATMVGPARVTPGTPRAWTAGLPLLFEPNMGQMNRRARFISRGPGYNLFLTEAGLVVTMPAEAPGAKPASPLAPTTATQQDQAVLRIDFVGQARAPRIEGEDRRPTVIHHHLGNDRSKWRTDIPTYGRAVYRDLYPGIDMVVRGGRGGPAYDFVVAPRAEPAKILMRFPGAERLSIDKAGNLVSRIAGRDIRHAAPTLYQEADGKRMPVAGRYELRGASQVAFRVGRYDRTRPLIIDPTLRFETVAGGGGDDSLYGLAVDDGGNAYAVGQTGSSNFPPLNSTRTAGSSDAFLVKLRGNDGAPEYVTFFGGGSTERAMAVAVTGAGEAYVTGFTHSLDFPTSPGVIQPAHANAANGPLFIFADAFATRFDAAGQLGSSTFLGGGLTDFGQAIALHASGVFIAGMTYSADLRPANLPSAYQNQRLGATDAFVTKLSRDFSTTLYSTYLGGSNGVGDDEMATGVAVNSLGEAHVVGLTNSRSNFPTYAGTGTPARSSGSGSEAFAAKLNAQGTALVYSTLLGGSGEQQELASGVALDASGNAYVVGYTGVGDFQPLQPLPPQTLQALRGGVQDGFLTKLAPDGRVLFSTYLGGASGDIVTAVTATAGKVWVAGASHLAPAYVQPENNVAASPVGWADAFVGAVAADGSSMTYWRFFGGSDLDQAKAVAANASGDIYVAGTTYSADYPSSGTTYGPRGGAPDIFVAKLATGVAAPPRLSIATTAAPQPTIHVGDNVTVSVKVRNEGTVPLTGLGLTVDFAGGPAIALTGWDARCAPSPGTSAVAAAAISCTLGTGSSGTLGIGGEDTVELRGQAVAPGQADNVAIAFAAGAAPASSRTTWTVLPREPARRELSVAVTPSPDPFQAGDTVTLSASVRNSGNMPLTNVRLSNNFIGGGAMQLTGWSPSCVPQPGTSPVSQAIVDCSTLGTIPGTLGVGETATVTFTGRAVAPGQVTDIATATAESTATAQSVLTRTVTSGPADLRLTLQVFDPPEVGARLSPLVALLNDGPQAASSILVRVTIAGMAAIESQPAICTLVTAPIGSPQTLECGLPGPYAMTAGTGSAATAFSLALRPTAPGPLTICAMITRSSAADPVAANNTTCQDVVVPPPVVVPNEPRLSITNQASHANLRIGEPVGFKAGITNSGNVPLTGAQFQATFVGKGLIEFGGFEADPQVHCSSLVTDAVGNTRVSCTVADAPDPGESRGIKITARAADRGTATSTVIAVATETGPIWMISTVGHQIQP